jgi:hypothetical protein
VGALSAAITHDHKGIDGKRFHDEVTMMYTPASLRAVSQL